mgnify:CR=1 FL=1
MSTLDWVVMAVTLAFIFLYGLYKNRNEEEAQVFMDNITHYLNMPENGTILDLACGKGRHSIYLNKLGYKVTGVDLSENSIAIANESSNESLQFKTHDMREPMNETYDAVFNLFTSFGYFDIYEDNIKTKAIKEEMTKALMLMMILALLSAICRRLL